MKNLIYISFNFFWLVSYLLALETWYEYSFGEYVLNSDNSYFGITFIQDNTYGDIEEKDIYLGLIRDIAIDNSGRVFIADRDNVVIHVYSPDGEYVNSIGRQGRGPGEFLNIGPNVQLTVDSKYLYVSGTDGMLTFERIHIFNLSDLNHSHTVILNNSDKLNYDSDLESYFPKEVFPLNTGNFLVSYSHMRSPEYFRNEINEIKYFLVSENGSIMDGPVLVLNDIDYLYKFYEGRGYIYYEFSFLEKPLVAFSNDKIFTSKSDALTISILDRNGNSVDSIKHSFSPLQLTRKNLIELYERIDLSRLDFYEGEDVALQMIREAENLPDTWPALNNILLDDENQIWVSTIVEDFDIYEWWVLEESGELITKFEWPRDKPIEVVKNGYVYTQETDEKTGLQQIVRYRVEFDEK